LSVVFWSVSIGDQGDYIVSEMDIKPVVIKFGASSISVFIIWG